jgi:hypothetical protein
MDTKPVGRADDAARVTEIRSDVVQARARIADTLAALGHKADIPGRIGDVLSGAAARITARVLQRIPSASARSGSKE